MPNKPAPDQDGLPGLDVVTERKWIVTVRDHGLARKVLVNALSKREARETFLDEFDLYEIGVEDDEFDWDHEVVYARSADDAERIALARDRDYMRTYDTVCLGVGEVVAVDRADAVDGWKERRAQREAELVGGGDAGEQ